MTPAEFYSVGDLVPHEPFFKVKVGERCTLSDGRVIVGMPDGFNVVNESKKVITHEIGSNMIAPGNPDILVVATK